MSKKPKILFLYTELAGYTIACLDALAAAGAEVHVVRRPVNSEAPFVFRKGSPVFYYERNQLSRRTLLELAIQISPSLIIVSGWVDKDYLYVSNQLRSRANTVLAFDNQWKASLRQRLASWFASVSFIRNFDYAWVPGKRQETFARKLGFSKERIQMGFYSSATDLYNAYYENTKAEKKDHFPRRFVFVGRYYEFKGISDLWAAYSSLHPEELKNWELWCLGTGDIPPLVHPGIRHWGFVQPDQMEEIIRNCGVFILPSRFEPWGVAVQEFAAAGFPLLCSSQVGAADAFLKVGINGYIYEAGDIGALKSRMIKFISMSDDQLLEMGRQSHQFAGLISPESWAAQALSMARTSVLEKRSDPVLRPDQEK
jgi:glycosyltransferase involved in cell wall biosynthesis